MVDALLELCRDIGIPEKLIMDGDGAQNNPQVLRIVNDYMIKVHNSEPENQQQNRAERGGATVKQGLRRLHFETRFDLAYWNYAVVHFCDCFNHTACRELGWQCRLEKLHGPTQDISVFRFVFWSLVWFWDPHIKFPASQWRLGRFLGRAKNVGDPFTFGLNLFAKSLISASHRSWPEAWCVNALMRNLHRRTPMIASISLSLI
jgi:hypothetical protein